MNKEKQDEISRRMEKLGVAEKDLVEKFILGSGKGGQKINKTSSCVYLKHLPSGFEIKCQQERSRELNRQLARRALCSFLEEQIAGVKSKKIQEIEKIRRQKRRRSRKSKEKMLGEKKGRAVVKRQRARPPSSE